MLDKECRAASSFFVCLRTAQNIPIPAGSKKVTSGGIILKNPVRLNPIIKALNI
jgi:hypothetical protein